MASASNDSHRELLERVRRYPPRLGDAGPQSEAIHTRRPVLVRDVSEDWVRTVARSSEHAEVIRALDFRSLLALPLFGRDEKGFGALTFLRVGSREPFGEGDLELAEEIARRAALAIENARLYDAARRATRARDDMLGVVSHDLRNPIHSIYMGGSFLLDLLPREMELERTQAAVIKRAAERANRLIQDLLDITHIESGRLPIDVRPYQIASLVDEALEQARMTAANAGVDLRRGDVDAGTVGADRDRVLQALGNLVGNALKFTPRGGRVVVSAHVDREGGVRFAVADTGPGIERGHLPYLFDRYWQASRKDRRGVGLGLSIVKGIAEAHGGAVHVDTQAGAGSTFTLVLPNARLADREVAARERGRERGASGGEARA